MTQLQTPPEALGHNPENERPEVLRGEVVERLAAACMQRLSQQPWELSDINPDSRRDISMFPSSLDSYNRLERSYAVPRYYASVDPLWVKQFSVDGRVGDFLIIGARYNLLIPKHMNEQAVVAYDLDLTEGTLRPISGPWSHYEQFARNLAKRHGVGDSGAGLADQAELLIREMAIDTDTNPNLTAPEKSRTKYGQQVFKLAKGLIADPSLFNVFERAPQVTTTMLRLRDKTGQPPHNAVGMALVRTGIKFERLGVNENGEPEKTVIYLDTENGFGSVVKRIKGVAPDPPMRDSVAGQALVAELAALTEGLRAGIYEPYNPDDPAQFEFPELLDHPGRNRFRVPGQRRASEPDDLREYVPGGRYIITRDVL